MALIRTQDLLQDTFENDSNTYLDEAEVRELMELHQPIPCDDVGMVKMAIRMDEQKELYVKAPSIVVAMLLEEYEYAEFLLDVGTSIEICTAGKWGNEKGEMMQDDCFMGFGNSQESRSIYLIWLLFGNYDKIPCQLMLKFFHALRNSWTGFSLPFMAFDQDIYLKVDDFVKEENHRKRNRKYMVKILGGIAKAKRIHAEEMPYIELNMNSVQNVNTRIQILECLLESCESQIEMIAIFEQYLRGYFCPINDAFATEESKQMEPATFKILEKIKEQMEKDKKLKNRFDMFLLCQGLAIDQKQLKEFKERLLKGQSDYIVNSRNGKHILKEVLKQQFSFGEFSVPMDNFMKLCQMVDHFVYSRKGKLDETILKTIIENGYYEMIIDIAKKGLIGEESIPSAIQICFENDLKELIPCFIFIKNSEKFQRAV